MTTEIREQMSSRMISYAASLGVSLPNGGVDRVFEFYSALLQENAVQNLTRLTDPDSFLEGHLWDVFHLERSGFLLDGPDSKMDLGSGGGVPGLLHAHLFQKAWVLCDSEKQKAAFLDRFISAYSVPGSVAVNTRAEEWLANHSCGQVIARAVGTVSKIYAWIGRCSTWNQMILLKGPGWEKEWEEFQNDRNRKRLRISKQYSYDVGHEKKERKIVLLERA